MLATPKKGGLPPVSGKAPVANLRGGKAGAAPIDQLV